MADLRSLTDLVSSGMFLDLDQSTSAASLLAGVDETEAQKGEFLVALAGRGETAQDMMAFAAEFRKRAVDPGVQEWADRSIDIVGTGGDHTGGFNVSTAVVLTLATAGIPVMKHGNRGITSKCGSADLLSALGYPIEAPSEVLRRGFQELGFIFFFAPAYHPAFRQITPVRKALAAQGQRTIFNLLGPLINPGRPAFSLMGVFSALWVDRLADAAQLLGIRSGLVAHGIITPTSGIDELTTATDNRVKGFGELSSVDDIWTPHSMGLETSPFTGLQGGDVTQNLQMLHELFDGRGSAVLVNTVALNVSVALWICGKTSTPGEGVGLARELLLGGAVKKKVSAIREVFNQ